MDKSKFENRDFRKLTQEQLVLINTCSKTINQVRKVYGLEPVGSGDKLYYKIVS